MKPSIIAAFSLLASGCAALPRAVPVPEAVFEVEYVPAGVLHDDVAFEVNTVIDSFAKRDEESIANLLLAVNDSGIIFDLLDSIAASPQQIEGLANYTALLLGGLSGGGGGSGGLASSLNITRILGLVQDSGLLTSLADQTLLDRKFQPVLAHIIERVVRANEDVLLYLVTEYLQPASDKQKRATTDNSLATFASNLLGSVLNSQAFTSSLADTLNALNDTNVLVYVVKRFLSTERYINMTGSLVNQVLASGAVNVSAVTSSLNVSALLEDSLSDPAALVTVVTNVLSGNYSGLSAGLGKYQGAFSNIVAIMEDDGLFVELNDLIFPSSSAAPPKTTTQKKAQSVTLAVSTTAAPTVAAALATSPSAASGARAALPGTVAAALVAAVLLL
ncbi:GPI-anchored protein [[Candida] zeylanoides]